MEAITQQTVLTGEDLVIGKSKLFQSAERVSHKILSDRCIYKRSLLAYVEALKLLSGNVLEIGCGEAYGLDMISQKAESYHGIDKYKAPHIREGKTISFTRMKVPPLKNIPDKHFDFVISFQVIEHIKNDNLFITEVFRVLKPNGVFILTTPNKEMSITRNPWHIREYGVSDLDHLLSHYFARVVKKGVFGNGKIMEYYEKNKESVRQFTRFDIFNLQYLLPRFMLQLPYDILNRVNRNLLLKNNTRLLSQISLADFFLGEANDQCFDLFYIGYKGQK
jgi:2-polyprenyl-3-methyl-5-hydroxy-6-metoxy-1,4-benzoquinol methylase